MTVSTQEENPEPIIVRGKPSRLPLRGPLQVPTTPTQAQIELILRENDLMLQIAEDIMAGECNISYNPPIDQVGLIMHRMQRNLLYLAIVCELQA